MSVEQTVSLEAVFDAIPVGLGIVDTENRIVLMNRAFRESLGLPRDAIPPGTPVEDAVRASALRGVYGPGDPDVQIRAVMAGDRSRPGRLRRRTFAGKSHDLYNTPLPGGGYVVSAVETTALLAARADAEAALSHTATALTTLRIGLAIFDPQHRLVLANPRFTALLALPPDRLPVGSSFEAMLALMETREEFATPDGAAFIDSLRGVGSGQSWAVRRQRADGRSIDIMVDPLPDGGCTIAVNDITPQARAEDEASRRARLLDLVLLNVPHGICVYGADHRVAMFNDNYNKVMEGAPLHVGDSLADVVRRRAEAGEYGEGDLETIIATQMAYHITRAQERRRVRPNGTSIDIRTAPMPDGGHISVVTDISALVQAEAELRRRAEEMSTMLDNIRHGIMLWGPDRRLVASNRVASDLMALPAGVLAPGQSEAKVIAALSAAGHFGPAGQDAPMARALADLDRSIPFGREIVTPSGRVLFAQSNPAPGGGWISTFTDITQMRQAKQELRRAKDLAEAANLAKSRFLATMSHELRTPLNAIIGFSDAMAQENGDMPAQLVAEYSGQINNAGKQLLSLINIILDVARIESGRFEPGGDVFEIERVIQSVVRQADSAAQAGEVAVIVKLQCALPLLCGDEGQVAQALCQLVSNAVKFTPSGGTVTIEAGLTPDAEIFLAVADTGIGIPAADLERVFEPFMQLDGSLARRYPGAGLGLFMARAIVSAHGGRLSLTSQLGRGTTARITLPKARIVNQAAS
ncbi:MAG TPA: hypothetical protein DDZ81_03825 [Acetobacteraceae bacterium]|jgi:signal transduction histidine kinase|nr:hypothetical protein [Acetobacteraceae bacterium]